LVERDRSTKPLDPVVPHGPWSPGTVWAGASSAVQAPSGIRSGDDPSSTLVLGALMETIEPVLASAGDCPVCSSAGILALLVSVADGSLLFVCPGCGCAWTSPPPPFTVDEIVGIDQAAPRGLRFPTVAEMQAFRAAGAELHEVSFSDWESDLAAHLVETRGPSVMPNDGDEHVDLLVDGMDGEDPTVALSTGDICLQWHALPKGALRAMREMLAKPSGTYKELRVGEIFGVPLYLVEREGIFSFKASSEHARADLLRIDLSHEIVVGTMSGLDDAIETWEG
jgi:hypothetical protein